MNAAPNKLLTGFTAICVLEVPRGLPQLPHGFPHGFLISSRVSSMPGVPSKLSRALGNVQAELRSGKTRGSNPRALTAEEIVAKTALRDDLRKKIRENARERKMQRINAHTSSEADRVIAAQASQLTQATTESRAFFAAVSGVGSSAELRAQAALLRSRAAEQAKNGAR